MMVIDILFDILLIFLSLVAPKKKGSFLMGASRGDQFIGNPAYFYRYLLDANHQNTYWITGCKELFAAMERDGYPVLYKYSFKAFTWILRSEFLVIEQMPRDILYFGLSSIGRFNYVQTFHGIALKKIGLDAAREGKGIAGFNLFKVKLFDRFANLLKRDFKKYFLYRPYKYIIATSKMTADICKSAFGSNRVHILGYPRNDIFYQSFPIPLNVLDLTKNFRKVFTYVPTFRDNYTMVRPFSDEFYAKIEKEFKKRNWLLAIKKHPYDKNIVVPRNFEYIKDYSDIVVDLQPLLLATDVLITDYSSVTNDFCLTGRPVIFYTYDVEEYRNRCRSLYLEPDEAYSGPFALDEDVLVQLVLSVESWTKEKKYKERYKEMVNLLNTYKDGNSSERLLRFLQDR
ncbi:MAG: CDP-glycerol glycerophosphotransferase family protein [Spirochaetes bacterium]|nr:CDP-glycerol glycerophosphotransferase family protein [Spirochaetota bacterium]